MPTGGDWQRISYARDAASARGASARRCSSAACRSSGRSRSCRDNDLEHLTAGARRAVGRRAVRAGVAGLFAGVAGPRQAAPHPRHADARAWCSPATPRYAKAIAAAVPRRTPSRAGATASCPKAAPHRRSTRCCDADPAPAVDAAHAGSRPRHDRQVPVHLGLDQAPKGVINTHRMLCANQQMLRQCMRFLAEEPPVLVDWLPWNHTFGGNHNVGIMLVQRRHAVHRRRQAHARAASPRPCATCARSRPRCTSTCPRASRRSRARWRPMRCCARTLFARCKAFMFAGAGLAQAVWDSSTRIAEAADRRAHRA